MPAVMGSKHGNSFFFLSFCFLFSIQFLLSKLILLWIRVRVRISISYFVFFMKMKIDCCSKWQLATTVCERENSVDGQPVLFITGLVARTGFGQLCM